MAIGLGEHPEERGLSARHLVLLFLAGVAVCGVFFSLGFLVGFNERSSRAAPATEQVTTPATIPPTVNPPDENVGAAPKEPDTTQIPSSPAPEPAPPPAATVQEEKPKPASAAASPRAKTVVPSAKTQASRPTAAPAPAIASPGQGIALQVAALRAKQDADALAGVLKGRGYPVFLMTPEHAHAGDNLFRVEVGPFKTRDDAERARAKLSQEGFKPFVRH